MWKQQFRVVRVVHLFPRKRNYYVRNSETIGSFISKIAQFMITMQDYIS